MQTILSNLQKMCDYQAEKLRIYEEHLTDLTGKERPKLSDSDKRSLAQKGKALNDFLLAFIEPTRVPGTLRGWHNALVGANYDSTKSPNPKKRGRKPISQEIVDEVLKLTDHNPAFNFSRYKNIKSGTRKIEKRFFDMYIIINKSPRNKAESSGLQYLVFGKYFRSSVTSAKYPAY